jgi:hypothetical protein
MSHKSSFCSKIAPILWRIESRAISLEEFAILRLCCVHRYMYIQYLDRHVPDMVENTDWLYYRYSIRLRCDNTEHRVKGWSNEPCLAYFQLILNIKPRWRKGAGIHVLYSDRSLKWLAICMVSAEMIKCKLLSAQSAGIKDLYFTWCDGNHQWPCHGRTLARTLCSEEELNAIAR